MECEFQDIRNHVNKPPIQSRVSHPHSIHDQGKRQVLTASSQHSVAYIVERDAYIFGITLLTPMSRRFPDNVLGLGYDEVSDYSSTVSAFASLIALPAVVLKCTA